MEERETGASKSRLVSGLLEGAKPGTAVGGRVRLQPSAKTVNKRVLEYEKLLTKISSI